MASLLKDKFNSARKSMEGSNGSDESDTEIANKYMLRVTAGGSYNASTHKPVYVNGDTPCVVENDLLTAKIKVRIRNYHGLPKGSQSHSAYFDDPVHGKDQYSIGFSFVPKKDIPSRDLVWGNDFDHPVRDRLPPGFNTAFKIVKEFIDPGLSCDAYADEPWLYGSALSSWFALRIGEKSEGLDFPAPAEDRAMQEGADGSGEAVRNKLNLPDASDKRRKYFLDAKSRETLVFEKGRCYQGDFYNPYLDFSKFALKLPGFSLGVIRYINDKTHHLRYTFKNRETGEVCFCVVLTLLFGDELQKAIAADQGPQKEDAAEVTRNGEPNEKPTKQSGVSDNEEAAESREGNARPGAESEEIDPQTTLSAAGVRLKQTQEMPNDVLGETTSTELNDTVNDDQTKDGVSEISQMLQDTATSDGSNKKGGYLI